MVAGKKEDNGKKDLSLHCGEKFRYENCATQSVATGIPNEDVGNDEKIPDYNGFWGEHYRFAPTSIKFCRG